MAKIAVIGEGVIDRFISGDTFRDVIGGSGLNTAVAIKRAGADVIWYTRVPNDANGALLQDYANHEDVLPSSPIQADEPAALVRVYIQKDGQPQYEFELEGAADWQWQQDDLKPLKDFEIIQIGSLSAVLEPGSSILLKRLSDLRETSTAPLITYDPNARPSVVKSADDAQLVRNRILDFVRISDLVKVSDEDLMWISQGKAPSEVAREWSNLGPKIVVMTKGAKGASVFVNGEQLIDIPGLEINVKDTVGAGDTFMGWLLAQIATLHKAQLPTKIEDIALVVQTAIRAAAITCTREGCNPPFASEVS